ncbi:MAG: Hsp20/alpha crystallin family protein [Chloroflexi bacterium]|nr:Hsp20/alpha crystallin family protein [Chloroflexota bacterium]
MTTITRWNPFREMAAMQSALDRLFDDTWRTTWPTTASNALPLDVHETDSAYTVVTALPGLNADQINVKLENGALIISANVPQPSVPDKARVLIQERPFGQFVRAINLPQPVDTQKVEATYEQGILTLTLPKSPEAQPKLIPIKANGKLLQSSN